MKIYHVQAQTLSYTNTVIVSAEVVAENSAEAEGIFTEKLFHSGKLYEFLQSSELPNIPTAETPKFKRLDSHYLNY